MKRAVKIVLGGAAILILVSIALAQTSVQRDFSHAAGSSVAARCLGKNLSVSRISDDAGVGNRAVNFAFTNISGSPCTLKGHPGFALLDRRGRALRGVRVTMVEGTYFQPEEAAQEITLEPGKTAWFQVAYTAVQSTPRKCPVSAKVKIIAPGTTRVFILPEHLDPCQGTVTVTPVRNALPE